MTEKKKQDKGQKNTEDSELSSEKKSSNDVKVDVGMNPLYAGILSVICACGILLGMAVFLPHNEPIRDVGISDMQILNIAYEASENIIKTAEGNIGIDIVADAGTLISKDGKYVVSFPIIESGVYSDLTVELDMALNLIAIGFNEETTTPAVFLSIISVDNEELQYCAEGFLDDELIGNIIQKYYEAPSFTPGAQVHLSISKYIKCNTISFPYGLSITPEYVEVTVMNGVTVKRELIDDVVANSVDISSDEIKQGIYLEINRQVNETTVVQELQPLSVGYGILPPELPGVAEGGSLQFQL
jgi:hypothetical protein